MSFLNLNKPRADMTDEERQLFDLKSRQSAFDAVVQQAKGKVGVVDPWRDPASGAIVHVEGNHAEDRGTNWTDRDISGTADAIAADVSRADVVPMRKREASPPKPTRPAPSQPLRPAAELNEYQRALRKLRLENPRAFKAHLDRVLEKRIRGEHVDGLAELRKVYG